MATLAIPQKPLQLEEVALTRIQSALIASRVPILDAAAVARYKKRAVAKIMAVALLAPLLPGVAVVTTGWVLMRQLGAVPPVILVVLFGIAVTTALVNLVLKGSGLYWAGTRFSYYHRPVPQPVLEAYTALAAQGIHESELGVEYLAQDPILFIEDFEDNRKRYDLVIW